MTRLFISLLASLLVAGCSGGIGGTGIRADGGIGGTGARAGADVTLFGVITAFGSIWVNGVEVQYDRSTPIELNGAPELAVGQTVLVQARTSGGNEARASSIRVADAVVGPVTATDAARGLVYVAGRPVRVDASTPRGAGVTADLPRAGETLRVSGFATSDGTIVATRVERAQPGARAPRDQVDAADLRSRRFIVEGYVTGISRDELRVGAVAFASESPVSAALARDQLVRVSGRNENGRLVVDRAERVERAERGERGGRDGRGSDDRPDNSGRGSVDRPDRSGPDRPERPERPDRSGSDRPERPERSGKH